jgi:predicted transport protein
LFSSHASALLISEINFNPLGTGEDEEWVEIYNDTSGDIVTTNLTLEEDGKTHNEIKGVGGVGILGPGEYGIILKEKSSLLKTSYSGKAFTASFSLKDKSSNLVLRIKGGQILHSVSYSADESGTNEGDTISVIDGVKYRSLGTPGTVNSILSAGSNSSSTSSTATSTTTTSTTTDTTNQNTNIGSENINYYYRNYWPETEKIYINPGENKVVMQGQEIIFNPKVLDGNKREVKNGLQYKWSFGDGYTSEKREGLHSYKFVGEFVVNLQVNYNGFVDESKLYIKVVEPKVRVKIVEKNVDTKASTTVVDVVEVKNENNFELNVGNLELKNQNNKIYILPERLFILGNKSIFLAPELTGFASNTEKVVLSLSNGKVLSEFIKEPKAQVNSTTSLGTTTQVSAPILPKKIVIKKVIAKPKKEEVKAVKPEVVQSSSRIDFKSVSTMSFFDRIKKVMGI